MNMDLRLMQTCLRVYVYVCVREEEGRERTER